MNTKRNKLIQLLNSFEDVELKRFHQFLSSPYFNTDSRLSKLLSTLQKLGLNKISLNTSTKSKIYQTVFSDIDSIKKEINQVQKNKLSERMSRLFKLAKEFLEIEAFKEHTRNRNHLLEESLLVKKQYALFEDINTKTRRELIKQRTKEIEDYAHEFQINKNRLKYISIKNLFPKEDNSPDMIYQLDMYFLLQKLQLHIAMMSIRNSLNKQYDFSSFQAIQELITLPRYKDHPLIILYLTIIDLIENNQEVTYYKLLKLLEEYSSDISKGDLTDFYTVASNFCGQQIRAGKLEYINKGLQLYKVIEQKDLLLEGNTLQIEKLINIVNLSCYAKEFKWATELVEKYYPYVNKEEQISAYHLNLGFIDFHQENYKGAISHLIRIEKSGLTYALHYRVLLLKSYYQIDEDYDERTMKLFRSSGSFVSKNKSIFAAQRESHKNFIEVLISLYRLRHRKGKVSIEKVYDKIQKKEVLGSKQWLLEKLEELKDQRR